MKTLAILFTSALLAISTSPDRLATQVRIEPFSYSKPRRKPDTPARPFGRPSWRGNMAAISTRSNCATHRA